MKWDSLFFRIVLVMAALAVLSVAGVLVLDEIERLYGYSPVKVFRGIARAQMDQAISTYERYGPEELAFQLTLWDQALPARHIMLDARGHDLVDQRDYSGKLRFRQTSWVPNLLRGWLGMRSEVLVHVKHPSGKYQFLVIPRGEVETARAPLVAAAVALLLTLVAFSWFLSRTLVRPIQALRDAVREFGSGHLEARFRTRRRDELGDLAGAFNDMANRIEKLLTSERRLLQDVSHELRSPLARLGFAIELARTSSGPHAMLDRIKLESDRMARLVDDLLQMARAENDPLERRLEPVSVHELVERLADECKIEADGRGVELALTSAGAGCLTGDPEQLRRAFENVLRNAIRHAPAGSRVEIALRRTGDELAFTVRDYGRGVPEEHLVEIFRPFWREDAGRGRESGGVGLGLAIAQRAVALHRGRIHARNAAPGLSVTIELPVMPVEISAAVS